MNKFAASAQKSLLSLSNAKNAKSLFAQSVTISIKRKTLFTYVQLADLRFYPIQ